MQLIWLLIVTLICSISDTVIAAQKLSTTVMSYSDSTDVSITEEVMLYQVDLSAKTQLSIDLGIDSVSSASFEVATTATPLAEDEVVEERIMTQDDDDDDDESSDTEYSYQNQTKVRTSGALSLTHLWTHDIKTTTSISGSSKSDYVSQTLGQTLSLPLGSKTTLALGAYFTSNQNSPENVTTNVYLLPPEGKNLDSTRISGLASLERLLSPTKKLKLLAEAFKSTGYQSTGYQRMSITDSTKTNEALEVLPDGRKGAAITAVYSQWIDPGMAFHLRGRYYKDSYSINAWTTDMSLPFYLNDKWIITPRYRYYNQTMAQFWMEEAETVPTGYFTNSYSLGEIKSYQIGLGVARNFDATWFSTPIFGTLHAGYDYYTAESGFYSQSLTVGLDINF
jgi:hypothetical protein